MQTYAPSPANIPRAMRGGSLCLPLVARILIMIGIMNPLGALAFLISLAAFAFVQRQLGSCRVTAKLGVCVALTVLSLPAFLFTAHYLHVLPERAWLYEIRSRTGSEFLVVFAGAAGGAIASWLPRKYTLLPLLGATLVSIAPFIKPLIAPLSDVEFHEHWEGQACLQSTASTCGPASTATVLKFLNASASEHEIARAAFSYAGGTEAWYLARYVRHKGFEAKFEFGRGFNEAMGLPAVVGILHGDAGHFIAVLSLKDGEVTYADPLFGMSHASLEEFRRGNVFTGFRMVITKP